MRIYRLQCDVNHYQSFLPENPEVWDTDMLTFDATPKASAWTPPAAYVLHPKHKRGNFLSLSGRLVVDPKASDDLFDLLEMSGELLPLPYMGELFHVINVTECINVLDEDRTKWVIGRTTGARIGIESYGFHAKRLTETPLFKVPETCKADIYTVEGMKDPDDEFKGRVERRGLQGLIFEEVWTDEK